MTTECQFAVSEHNVPIINAFQTRMDLAPSGRDLAALLSASPGCSFIKTCFLVTAEYAYTFLCLEGPLVPYQNSKYPPSLLEPSLIFLVEDKCYFYEIPRECC